ncbi:hypothetical protein BHE90_009559 [Fusarium euwallaceae]|uniref:Protein kinase domain-containing protein n=2 Tax=Fusarium solani species complex TaxID=232080 RepID=A0A430LJU5_9HYPO|nr:hypothetical protein CDV31_013709 [Fusarium ambrosium]RTE75971.1 hypothetical protein BHE90_009559 [Fusarium euwallaceae]
MDSTNERGMPVNKRHTRLADYFADSEIIQDEPTKGTAPQEGISADLSISGKRKNTLSKSQPEILRKAPPVPAKRVTFADLPTINEETKPTENVEKHKENVGDTLSISVARNEVGLLEQHYEPYFDLTLGRHEELVIAATEQAAPDPEQTSVIFWNITGPSARDQVSVVRTINHKNFVRGLGVYPRPEAFIVAYEFLPISLLEVATSRKLRGPEMACILKQILDGLMYLEELNLGHPELTCSNILLDTSGHVKIWGQHFCRYGMADNLVAGLWRITAELMIGYDEGDLEEIDYIKWAAYPIAVDFYEFMKKQKDSAGEPQGQETTNAKFKHT